jgi:hypothetical protein
LQPPEKGKLQEWLQDLVVRSRSISSAESPFAAPQGASHLTGNDLPLGNLQPFLQYLLTLDAPLTDNEEHNIAHQFGVDPAHLQKLISRMRFDENGQTNK